jgi:hypothetical protein
MAAVLERLTFTDEVVSDPGHEIHGVVRGLNPVLGRLMLIGEGMGVGGVIGVLGRRAVFPLEAETYRVEKVTRIFKLNGISVKHIANTSIDGPYKFFRTLLAPLYLRSSFFRPAYTLLMAARSLSGVRSRYVRVRTFGKVVVEYLLNGCEFSIRVRRDTPSNMDVLVANELSGRLFTKLFVDGVGRKLTPWQEVMGGSAFLYSPRLKLGMEVEIPENVRAYAGREVLGRRLDWAGVSLVMNHELPALQYRVRFKPHE